MGEAEEQAGNPKGRTAYNLRVDMESWLYADLSQHPGARPGAELGADPRASLVMQGSVQTGGRNGGAR